MVGDLVGFPPSVALPCLYGLVGSPGTARTALLLLQTAASLLLASYVVACLSLFLRMVERWAGRQRGVTVLGTRPTLGTPASMFVHMRSASPPPAAPRSFLCRCPAEGRHARSVGPLTVLALDGLLG